MTSSTRAAESPLPDTDPACRWLGRWAVMYPVFIAACIVGGHAEARAPSTVLPYAGLVAGISALAFWFRTRVKKGTHIGAAAGLVGFFAVGSPLPIAIVLSTGMKADHPWLIVVAGSAFLLVTLRTAIALFALLIRVRSAASEAQT